MAGCQQYVVPNITETCWWMCTPRLTHRPRTTPRLAVVDFYNQINLLYGAITEFCSPQSCPEMKATDE